MWRTLAVILLSISLLACSKPIEKDPKQHIFANGDIAHIHDNHVQIYNGHGKLLQQSTFHSPTFLEARSFLIDIQQDLKARHYADFLQGDIAYPLVVIAAGKKTVYQNSVQLQAAFNDVFTADILQTIISTDPFRLTAHQHHVSFAKGKIWFNKHGIYQIIK